jgi:hypothetical protein
MTPDLENTLRAIEQTSSNTNISFDLLEKLGYSPAAESPELVRNLWLVRQARRLENSRQRIIRLRKARVITHEQCVVRLRDIDQLRVEAFNYLTGGEAA